MAILIAGAGIAGLATAVALAQTGQSVRLLEKRSVLTEAGAGIQMGPNGVKALAALGLLEALQPNAFRPERIAVFQGRTGRRLTAIDLGDVTQRYHAPYLTVHRADLQAALLAAAKASEAITLLHDFDVATIEQSDGTVTVRAADGRTETGVSLIGADGLWSRVRQLLGGPMPKTAGYSAYRALIPRPRLTAPFDAPQVGLWIGRDAHVVHYPVRGGERLNIVVIVKSRVGSPDWDQPGAIADLTPNVARWSPAMGALLTQAPEWRRWTLYDLPAAGQWYAGNTCLVGDAAHPLLPFLAQGAVMALEDAVTLAGLLSNPGENHAAAFSRFEAWRRPRLTRVANASRRNGSLYHQSGLVAAVRDLGLRMTNPKGLLTEYDWLFGYDPRKPAA